MVWRQGFFEDAQGALEVQVSDLGGALVGGTPVGVVEDILQHEEEVALAAEEVAS